MGRHAAIWSVVLASQLLAACETFLTAPSEKLLRLYQGSPRPLTEIAVLKSAPAKMSQNGSPVVTVELMGVNGKRFRGKGGWGNGVFEVHLWPGMHTLHLRYRALRPSSQAGGAREEVASDKDSTFTLVAQAGHTYLLSAEIMAESAKSVQWLPVVFDKTRRTAWRRENEIKRPENESAVRETAIQEATVEGELTTPQENLTEPSQPIQR